MFKLKNTIIYKPENENSGYLFSIGDDSKKLLKVTGLVAEISASLASGSSLEDIIEKILSEYEVDKKTLLKDLKSYEEQLSALDFIDA